MAMSADERKAILKLGEALSSLTSVVASTLNLLIKSEIIDETELEKENVKMTAILGQMMAESKEGMGND